MSPATAHAPTTRGLGAATSCDQRLMERLAAGDPDAFEELYRRHYRRVLMQATKLCASRELAEEVAQETLLALWRGARLYRPELGSVSAWLSGMVRNRAIDAWRRTASRPTEVEICDEGGGQLEGASVTDAQSFERAAVLSAGRRPAARAEGGRVPGVLRRADPCGDRHPDAGTARHRQEPDPAGDRQASRCRRRRGDGI